jgi:hypothetical protein
MKRLRTIAMIACVLCILAACDTPTPTVAPVATVTPTVTYSSTQTPTRTPTPTYAAPTQTPLACATQYPMASLVIRAFLDMDKDGQWGYGDLGMAWFKARLVYTTGIQMPITYVVMSTNGTWAGPMLPGVWQVLPDEYAPSECVVIGEYENWLYMNAGTFYGLNIPYNETCRPGTATPTATPQKTPTAQPYTCPVYQINCLPACGANQVVDPLGQCGSGFVCCKPMPTRTAVP